MNYLYLLKRLYYNTNMMINLINSDLIWIKNCYEYILIDYENGEKIKLKGKLNDKNYIPYYIKSLSTCEYIESKEKFFNKPNIDCYEEDGMSIDVKKIDPTQRIPFDKNTAIFIHIEFDKRKTKLNNILDKIYKRFKLATDDKDIISILDNSISNNIDINTTFKKIIDYINTNSIKYRYRCFIFSELENDKFPTEMFGVSIIADKKKIKRN